MTPAELRARIVDAALKCIDQDGPEPWAREAGLRLGPNDKPQWCGLFRVAIWRRAGVVVPDWVMSKGNLGYLRKLGLGERAQPGDVGYIDIDPTGHRVGHNAIVASDDGAYVRSIDGNGPGGRVVERIRPRRHYTAFYSIDSLLGASAPTDANPAPSIPGTVRGLDVSAYQDPMRIDYMKARTIGLEFVYVRAIRQGRDIDSSAVEHVRRARAAGLRVGLYAFFSPDETAAAQIDLIRRAHCACGMRPGDLAPALDLESHGSGSGERKAGALWVAPATEILEALASDYGTALRYHNVTDWLAMARPAWEQFPLWVAAYRSTPVDTCGPWVVWQHRSARMEELGLILDQNLARELPTIRE